MSVHEIRTPTATDLITRDSPSLLVRYYDAIAEFAVRQRPAGDGFEPGPLLPELTSRVAEFLAPATADLHHLGEHGGLPLRLLDLRGNPGTQTTKTFASLLIVARAVRHVQDTGEPVVLFSPSSGNKAVALRDAVARAHAAGLVEPEQLRIVTLTPAQTTAKLRRSPLSETAESRAANPVLVLDGAEPEAVKAVGQKMSALFADRGAAPFRLWSSLRLENYRSADVVRGFFDYEFGTAGRPDVRTTHAHAVSSAFGLLGYSSGLDVLRRRGHPVGDPSFLLVQHAATCDMVLHALTGSFDRSGAPEYVRGPDSVWVQDSSAHFPRRTWDPQENLEHTFYTHRPATAPEMSGLISRYGGTGVVVSLLECVQRYAECRSLLAGTPLALPADPRALTEWSLVMALTGVLNAIDRGLLRDVDEVTLHGSGTYARDDYAPLPAEWAVRVRDAEDVLDAVLGSGRAAR